MKRLISTILVIVILLSLSCFVGSSATTDTATTKAINYLVKDKKIINPFEELPFGYIGDVDGDDDVSIIDVTHIQYHIAKTKTLSIDKKLLADIDRDDSVNITDATMVQRFIALLDADSNVKKYLCATVDHSKEDMENFDEIVSVLKENGKSYTSYGYTDYYLDGFAFTQVERDFYNSNYELRYEENFSYEGNTGSLLLSCSFYNEDVSDKGYLVEIRIYRGTKIIDIGLTTESLNEDNYDSEPLFENTLAITTGTNEDSGKTEYLFPADMMEYTEHFPDEERSATVLRFFEIAFNLSNKIIDSYTDVKLEDLI